MPFSINKKIFLCKVNNRDNFFKSSLFFLDFYFSPRKQLFADASSHTKILETPMPCFTTKTEVTISNFGKSMILTGDSAIEEMLLVTFKATSIVPSRSTDGEETHGNFATHDACGC